MTIDSEFLYVTCSNAPRVERCSAATGAPNGTLSIPPGTFPSGTSLRAVKVHKPSRFLYVLEYNNAAVTKFNPVTMTFVSTLVAPGSGGLGTPQSMVIGADNNVYIPMGLDNPRTKKYDGTSGAYLGDFATWAPAGFGGEAPIGITIGPDGDFYMATQSNNNLIRKVTYPGGVASVFAPPEAVLANPFGLVFSRVVTGGICLVNADCDTNNCVSGICR